MRKKLKVTSWSNSNAKSNNNNDDDDDDDDFDDDDDDDDGDDDDDDNAIEVDDANNNIAIGALHSGFRRFFRVDSVSIVAFSHTCVCVVVDRIDVL